MHVNTQRLKILINNVVDMLSLKFSFCFIEPVLSVINSEIQIPEITERQVWISLKALKKTATGPDTIPYWVWRNHAETFTPPITKIWNLSIATQHWPSSWTSGITKR